MWTLLGFLLAAAVLTRHTRPRRPMLLNHTAGPKVASLYTLVRHPTLQRRTPRYYIRLTRQEFRDLATVGDWRPEVIESFLNGVTPDTVTIGQCEITIAD